jgi:hypothetical protein
MSSEAAPETKVAPFPTASGGGEPEHHKVQLSPHEVGFAGGGLKPTRESRVSVFAQVAGCASAVGHGFSGAPQPSPEGLGYRSYGT